MNVKVHFLLEDLLVEAPAGTTLQRIADAAGADITFGCRTGSCGTCRVRVAEGLHHCSDSGLLSRRDLSDPPPRCRRRNHRSWWGHDL